MTEGWPSATVLAHVSWLLRYWIGRLSPGPAALPSTDHVDCGG
jgi:hypothetical protein